MRIVRRTAFAAPLVIVGCARPLPPIEAPEEEAPTARVVEDAPAWQPPPELVAALAPLAAPAPESTELAWPPPRPPRIEPAPPAGQGVVAQLARDRGGSMVRIVREDTRRDLTWKIHFVDPDGQRVYGSECEVVGWDDAHLDCRTTATPEELAPHGVLRGVLLEAEPIMRPLGKKASMYEICQRAFCNPPPSTARRRVPSRESDVQVGATARVGAWTRVRVWRDDDLQDTTWHVMFVDEQGAELPDGACVATDWGVDAIECMTALPPTALHRARLRPPSRFDRAAVVESVRATGPGQWTAIVSKRFSRGPQVRRDEHEIAEVAGEVCDPYACKLSKRPDPQAVAIRYPENNPPPSYPLEAPIAKLTVEAGAVRVDLARGGTSGVAVGMPVELRTADDKVRDRCTLDSVDARHASCLVTSTHDQLQPVARAIIVR